MHLEQRLVAPSWPQPSQIIFKPDSGERIVNVAEGDESAATMTIEAAMSKDRKCLRRCNGGHRSKTECIATWQYESPLWRREEALDNEFNATPRSGVC